MTTLPNTINRRILMETVQLHDHPERREQIQAYCTGYLRALKNSGATSMDEDDAWYCYMLNSIDHFTLKQPLDQLPAPPTLHRKETKQ